MPGPIQNADVCDAERARLSQTAEAVAMTLVELDSEPTFRLLAAGTPRGATAASWSEIRTVIDELWSGHRLLTDLIGEVARVRGGGRRISADVLPRVSALLFEDSIELSSSNVGLFERTLLGPRVQTTRTSPAGLVAQLESAFTRVQKPLASIAAAWKWQLQRLDAADFELRALRAKAPTEPDVERAAAALQTLGEKVGADPLGVHDSDFEIVDELLARARQKVSSAEELFLRISQITATGSRLLDEIAEAYEAAKIAHATAVVKIAGFNRPEPTVPDPGLADEFAALTSESGKRAAGRSTRLLAWQNHARYAYDQAVADRDAAEKVLRERNELRGRLDAYKAKARGYGLAESAQLSRMARRAQDLLYTAPCDLVAGRSAVMAYSAAITASIGGDV